MIVCASLFFVAVADAATVSSTKDLKASMSGQLNAFGGEFGASTEKTSDIRIVVARIIRVFLSLMAIVAVSYIIYGGYMYMTSGGSDERIGRARKIIFYGAIGLGIMVASFSITSFVYRAIYGATNPWNAGGNNSSFDIYTQDNNYNYNRDPMGGEMVPDEYDVDWQSLIED